MFRVAQRVAQTSNCFPADRSGCDAPFQKCFLRARDCLFKILFGCGVNAGQAPAINGRDLVDLRTAATPFTAKGARIFVGDAELLENRLHDYLQRRQYLRIKSTASSTTSSVVSSAGRKRIDCSPERNVSTPRSNKPFHISSRVFASGRSKARNIPRPRTALTKSNSLCKARI